jgi:dephospho-CoA kinase
MLKALVFAGKLGSGKTELSRRVADQLHARWRSFGATLRQYASVHGLSTDRESLQSLGADFVKNHPEELCQLLLADIESASGELVVIDGLRHAHIFRILERFLAPGSVVCIYVEIDEARRLERLQTRDGLTNEDLAKLDRHSTEIELPTQIRELADYIVNSSGPLDVTMQSVLNWIADGLNASG